MIQFLLMPVEVIYIYIIRERSGPKIDLSRTPKFISPAFEKAFFSVTKNFMFERDD